MAKPSPKVIASLIEIYKAVADAVDGGEELPDVVWEAYQEEFAHDHMKEFYGQLIDDRHAEVWGK